MKLTVSRDVKMLSLSFLLIFFSYSAVQQYVTTFFSSSGMADLGFQALIVVYIFFALFLPVSAIVVSKYGAKRCMMAAVLPYTLFTVLLLSRSAPLIYLGSCLLGMAGAFLWTSQNSYLIRASSRESYGTNSGFFLSLWSLGATLGILTLGVLISVFMFDFPFLLFSVFPLFGLLLLFGLKDMKPEKKSGHFRLLRKSFSSRTALKLSSLWFATNFISGLVIGILPIHIKDTMDISYIGILSSLFFILPIPVSYFFGRLSDIKGRWSMILVSYALSMAGLLFMSFYSSAAFLVFGILLLATSWAIVKPIISALVGDVSTESNLEFLTALFWMVQNISVVCALVISQVLRTEIAAIYLVSIGVMAASLLIVLPLLRQGTGKIRDNISQEIGRP